MADKSPPRSVARPSDAEGAAPDAWPGLRAVEIWMEIGTEACDFMVDRVRSDLETQQALLHCTSPMEMQVILMRHGHRAIEDYHREAGRMVQLLHQVPGAAAVLDS